MHTTATKTASHTDGTQAGAEPLAPVVKASPAQLPLWAQTGLPVQTRLTINQPGDKYEQEADRVADQVMRLPEPEVQRKTCSCSNPAGPDGMCAECNKKELGVQRLKSGNVPQTTAPPIVHQVLQQPGRPLDGATRNFMEARFGQNFSQVQVHTGKQATKAAQAVNARAFAVGHDIVFREGQYAPGTTQGRRLLAHELTHVMQQHSRELQSTQTRGEESHCNTGPERAAEEMMGAAGTHGAGGGVSGMHSDSSVRHGLRQVGAVCRNAGVRGNSEKGRLNFLYTATDAGRRLLAHELAHVVQQSSGERVVARQQLAEAEGAEGEGAKGEIGGPQGILFELPVEFVIEPVSGPEGLAASDAGVLESLSEVPGYPASRSGLAFHVLASGDLSWLSPDQAAKRVLSTEYWSPFVPRRGFTTIDRLTNTLPRNLVPRIVAEIESGGPLSWIVREFTEAELRSLPELVERFNTRGLSSLTEAELVTLRSAVATQIFGETPGSPLASYTRPNYTPPFLAEREVPPRFRARVEVRSTAVLDVSGPNAFNMGDELLTNVKEAEFMVVGDPERRIVSVERITRQTQSNPSFVMRHSGAIRWGGRLLFVAGMGVSALRIGTATAEEQPVVVAEEVGGQIGGSAGTALAVAGCLLFGVTTGGVGLFVCGLVGGVGGGFLGSTIAVSAARNATARDKGGGGASSSLTVSDTCPSCHALQRQWDREASSLRAQGFEFDPSSVPADARPLSPVAGAPDTRVLTAEELAAISSWIESVSAQETP